MSGKLSIQKRFHVTATQNAEIENLSVDSGHDEAMILRAALKLAMPMLQKTPGLIPLLQPGVLSTSPE